MNSKALWNRIDGAMRRLAPLFDISPEELREFPKPRLTREIIDQKHKDHEGIMGYEFIDNYFYFPSNDSCVCRDEEVYFCASAIQHEVGHYFHHQVNPAMTDAFRKIGKCPPGYFQLSELVANYSNFLLNTHCINSESYGIWRDWKKKFDKYGSSFLPTLARMSIDEAIEKGIVEIKASSQSHAPQSQTVLSS